MMVPTRRSLLALPALLPGLARAQGNNQGKTRAGIPTAR